MHFFGLALIAHTLIVAVIAFFVLLAASKADGFVRLLGNVLGWIILILAVLSLAVGVYHMATGKGPMGDRWIMHMQSEGENPGPAQTTQPPKPQ